MAFMFGMGRYGRRQRAYHPWGPQNHLCSGPMPSHGPGLWLLLLNANKPLLSIITNERVHLASITKT